MLKSCERLKRDVFLFLLIYYSEGFRMSVSRGTVKWFNTVKGYGFIKNEENGQDVFVHITALERIGVRSLQEGQKVTFELETRKGKTSAVNVSLI
jgi:CspA family cold shock protein